jgi:transposase
MKRHELTDSQWELLTPFFPPRRRQRGGQWKDDRTILNGIFWRLNTGAPWRDLPERYGKWKTLHKRFTRWAKAGVWDEVFASLIKDRDNQYLMLDSTLVRAHQQAATGKGGTKIRLWGAPEAD